MTVHEDEEYDRRARTSDPFETDVALRGGSVVGLVAAAVMGVAISVMDLPTLRLAIAGLYGQSGSLVAGWAAHLAHGAVFGVVFALLLADPSLNRVTEWYWKSTVAGVVYGTVLAVVGAGIVMPIWLRVAGFRGPPSIPHVTTPVLVWHLVFGVVLGVLFPVFADR